MRCLSRNDINEINKSPWPHTVALANDGPSARLALNLLLKHELRLVAAEKAISSGELTTVA